jgi:DNA repair protein RecO (recombination protein O)
VRTLSTDAIVLHAFDYRETSRIVRLATRDAGIVSAIARGARRPKSKFGSAIDLFTGGVAHIGLHPTGDLHTLNGFDSTVGRAQLADSLSRFGAAEALSEVCLRFGKEDDSGRVYEASERALDRIGAASPDRVAEAALAGLWHFVAGLGFAPSLDACALCHAPLDPASVVTFNHRAGGALCAACARRTNGGRTIPPEARATIARWIEGQDAPLADEPSAKAHRRLLREFLEEHLGDGRPLRAFLSWEELRP